MRLYLNTRLLNALLNLRTEMTSIMSKKNITLRRRLSSIGSSSCFWLSYFIRFPYSFRISQEKKQDFLIQLSNLCLQGLDILADFDVAVSVISKLVDEILKKNILLRITNNRKLWAMSVYRNIEARSCVHCCNRKIIIILSILLQPYLSSTQCVCSILYCHLWFIRVCHMFPLYLISGKILGKTFWT